MKRKKRILYWIWILFVMCPVLYGQASGPQPGDVYKEFFLNLKIGNNWRVTDPNSSSNGAQDFLPNPVMTFQVDDLDGAIKAEALFDIWGGHVGTIDKKFRLNGNTWVDVPDHPTIPEEPECYYSEFNHIFEVPLEQLNEGSNTLEGTSGGQTCFNFNWGQWGWYVMVVRVYYGPEKAQTTGSIISHLSGSDMTELDTIVIEAASPAGIRKVDLLGKYLGYDENGDGIYYDWHRNYHVLNIEEHIGTSISSPYKIVWDNQWIPDQEPHGISLVARICDKNNIWYVTEIVDSISLVRPEGVGVKMYTAQDVPKKFGVRVRQKKWCNIIIDSLDYATNARIYHRTWNGLDGGAGSGLVKEPLIVNSWRDKVGGANHNYKLSIRKVPIDALIEGTNGVGYESETNHHGIEILWPGPAMLVRYNRNAPQVATPVITPDSGEYKMPLEITIECETQEAAIYYSLDGTPAQIGDNRYLGPFDLQDSAIVSAIAVKFDQMPSELACQKYTSYLSPRMVRAYKGAINGTVEVDFNKPVEKVSAEDLSNYTIDNSGNINSATLDSTATKVVLEMDGMTEGEEYTLTVNNIIDDTGISIPFNSESTFLYKYTIEISASFESDDHPPEHSMDNDLLTYWSANGTEGVWIQYDLMTTRLVQSVDIAFYLGDTRNSYLIIATSRDGINWTEAFNGESSGTSTELEKFDIGDIEARYIRILGLGNSGTSNWNSYTEIRINWQWETGIPEYQKSDLKVYPIPASREIRIGLTNFPENANVYFVNTLGQLSPAIWIEEYSRLSIAHLKSGLYMLIVSSENLLLQKKIIIANEY